MILAIDQGTTGTTVLLVDHSGAIVDSGYAEIRQFYPKPGWVEHDAEEIAQGAIRLAREVCLRQGATPRAIGIVNQRETVVLWERKTGKPLGRAIVWQDRRTAPLCQELKADEPLFRDRCGLLLDPYFSGTKLAWMLDSDPAVRAAAESGDLAAGTIDAWLIWNMTGGAVHATDFTNASRTLCCDIRRGEWDGELLDKLRLPRCILPQILPSCHAFGPCILPGPLKGAMIGGVAGDQQAALFGQACWKPGLIKNTYGTGCFLMSWIGAALDVPADPILATAAASAGPEKTYALEGAVFVAGAAVQWLRDEMGLIESAADTDAIARSVSDSHGVFVVPAFAGLGAPHWDSSARGAILGLTRGAGRAHIVRATLESIAYQTADLLAVPALARNAKELRVDGGACRNDFLMQFQADILGMPIDRPARTETTALGAAFLAGLQCGFWSGLDELEALRQTERVFEPAMGDERRQALLADWRKAVRRVLG
ncbi:MAG: Glycerol kinase [candidate division BRC1 bacterium ADurb.BinA364]|nr:MAG: Glycerol kinase [candidate division BRC1 bacterium ADurb.BinA364]